MTLLIRYHKIRKRERETTAQARHVWLVKNRKNRNYNGPKETKVPCRGRKCCIITA